MPTQCRLIDSELLEKPDHPQPGDMWYAEWVTNHPFLSPQYKQNWADKRPPIIVCLPNGQTWLVDGLCGDGHGGRKDYGWTVTGEAPNITVSPSINDPGYHGFLQNGVFTDDLEGRTY